MDKVGNHFVLVHGACHGAWSWYKVTTLLRSYGHKVTAIDLGASGTNPKQTIKYMSDYMDPLMKFMECVPEDDRVVVVGHSAGGFSTSVAMEKFSQKIMVAVFVAAMMHSPHHSVTTLVQEIQTQTTNSHTMTGLINLRPPSSFVPSSCHQSCTTCHHQSFQCTQDLTLAEMLVRPYHLYADQERLANDTKLTKENYGSVQRVYIVLRDDCIIKEKLQRWMIEVNPPDEVKVISDSDHMVMCSNPRQLCRFLQEIADKYH